MDSPTGTRPCSRSSGDRSLIPDSTAVIIPISNAQSRRGRPSILLSLECQPQPASSALWREPWPALGSSRAPPQWAGRGKSPPPAHKALPLPSLTDGRPAQASGENALRTGGISVSLPPPVQGHPRRRCWLQAVRSASTLTYFVPSPRDSHGDASLKHPTSPSLRPSKPSTWPDLAMPLPEHPCVPLPPGVCLSVIGHVKLLPAPGPLHVWRVLCPRHSSPSVSSAASYASALGLDVTRVRQAEAERHGG